MPVSKILTITNKSAVELRFQCYDNDDAKNAVIDVNVPNDGKAHLMETNNIKVGGKSPWVPWREDNKAFAGRHMALTGSNDHVHIAYYFWQDTSDRTREHPLGIDSIRMNTKPSYYHGAEIMPGAAAAGGDKAIIIGSDSSITIQQYL